MNPFCGRYHEGQCLILLSNPANHIDKTYGVGPQPARVSQMRLHKGGDGGTVVSTHAQTPEASSTQCTRLRGRRIESRRDGITGTDAQMELVLFSMSF